MSIKLPGTLPVHGPHLRSKDVYCSTVYSKIKLKPETMSEHSLIGSISYKTPISLSILQTFKIKIKVHWLIWRKFHKQCAKK